MKLQLNRSEGSAIVMILVLTVLIGITLGSYLHMVSNQNQSIMRSMSWNQAVAVSEAGIEEAMAHLNYNTTNRNRDGWTISGTNVVKKKVLGDNVYKTYVNIFVEPPSIISEGYVKNPVDGEFLPNPRVVRVTTTNDALFAKGLVAKGLIDLDGKNIMTDSFDSLDPLYSTDGRYDVTKNLAGGDIATNSKLINVGNADIYGKASTGPGGIVSLGSHGTVGSKTWHADPANHGTIEPGWSSDDMNVQFPDVKYPFQGVITQNYVPWGPYTDSGTTYDYVIGPLVGTGNYIHYGTFNLNNKKLFVRGNVNLYVTGSISLSGTASIVVGTNSTLNLYVAGPLADLTGNGIMNKSGKSGAFSFWGMPSNLQVKIGGNAEFIGTVYAPQAHMDLGGGGYSSYDFIGASVTKSVKMNGHYKFHYDESLGMFGPKRGYTIVTWNEVSPISL